jgi:predicted ATP-grasp superfamily ATP-dependent carboligase
MKIPVIESNWSEFRRKVLTWLQKPRNDQLIQADRMRERSIRILQKRYGFTREQAASELKKHYAGARLG